MNIHDLRPWNESEHAEVVARLEMLDSPENAWEAILGCVRGLLGGIVSITLTDSCRALMRERYGIGLSWKAPPEFPFCRPLAGEGAPLIVADLRADPRFADHPMVAEPDGLRFYAGFPMRSTRLDAEQVVGSLALLGREPRDLSEEERVLLGRFAALTEKFLDARFVALDRSVLSDARGRVLSARDRWDRQFREAERLAGVGSWRLDLATATVEWSEQVFEIFGLPQSQGTPELEAVLAHYPLKDREILMEGMDRAIESGATYDLETDIVDARGVRRRIRNVGKVELVDGAPVAIISVCQDITERYAAEKALERSATTDELTDLPNRAALNAWLDRQFELRATSGVRLAVMLIDLDNFKKLNDTYGHAAGDEALRTIAAKLRVHAASLGFAARLGGDEFVLAVTDPNALDGLRGLLVELLCDLRAEFSGAAGDITVAATIGVCPLDAELRTKADLLKRADLALYRAKALGKGRAMVAGDMRPVRPDDTEPELRQAG